MSRLWSWCEEQWETMEPFLYGCVYGVMFGVVLGIIISWTIYTYVV